MDGGSREREQFKVILSYITGLMPACEIHRTLSQKTRHDKITLRRRLGDGRSLGEIKVLVGGGQCLHKIPVAFFFLNNSC